MLLIANRGNISGSNPTLENTPDYIDSVINQGYNAKVDLWYHNNKLFLGTKEPKTEIEWDWLKRNTDYLWINCMTVSTLSFLLEDGKAFNFFYNTTDPITLTSKGFPWSNTDQHTSGTITYNTDIIDGVLGVCNDHVDKWSKQIAICFYGDSGLPNKRTIKNHKTILIDVLEDLGYHLEYYGSKALNLKENDHNFNKIYNFKGLRSHLVKDKEVEEMEELHIKSIYEMIGSHPYETAFFIRWDQTLTKEEINNHIKTFNTDEII